MFSVLMCLRWQNTLPWHCREQKSKEGVMDCMVNRTSTCEAPVALQLLKPVMHRTIPSLFSPVSFFAFLYIAAYSVQKL